MDVLLCSSYSVPRLCKGTLSDILTKVVEMKDEYSIRLEDVMSK